jgi:hypothetical protein
LIFLTIAPGSVSVVWKESVIFTHSRVNYDIAIPIAIEEKTPTTSNILSFVSANQNIL